MLIVIAVLALLNMARGLVGYFQSADDGGIATQVSVGEFLLVAPDQTLVPAGIGVLSSIAAVGVFRSRRWSQILAIGVGAASLLGGVMLTMPAIAEWGVPGSFALLLLPAAFVAFLIGAYVLYAALRQPGVVQPVARDRADPGVMDSRRTAADRRSMNPAIADPERVRRIAVAVLGDE